MLALPHRGFVMLSVPKTGSTAIEEALTRHALVVLRGPPEVKHVSAGWVEDRLVPMLASLGYPRSSYQVVCLFREPFSWLASWWRYRARAEILDDPRIAPNYTGELSFEQFGQAFLAGQVRGIEDQSTLLARADGTLAVDRIFSYEDERVWRAWLRAQVPARLRFARRNVSASRTGELSPETRADLAARLAGDLEIHDHLRERGWWQPPPGYAVRRGAAG